MHSPGTCGALAARNFLRHCSVLCAALRCSPFFWPFDPQPLRWVVGIAGCSRASGDAADTRRDGPILQREQPDALPATQANQVVLRSRWQPSAPPAHYGGFAPTFVCHPSPGHDRARRQSAARVPPECPSATGPAPLLFARTAAHRRARRVRPPQPPHVGQQYSGHRPVPRLRTPCERFCEPALPDLSMCSGPWAESHAARSGLTLAGAADAGPAIHRCNTHQTVLRVASESRAPAPLSSPKRACQATFTRFFQCLLPKAVEPLGYVRPSPVACPRRQSSSSTWSGSIRHTGCQHHRNICNPLDERYGHLAHIVVHFCTRLRAALSTRFGNTASSGTDPAIMPSTMFHGTDKPLALISARSR